MIRFEPLLSVQISHAYYERPCGDFDYVLSAASAALLGRARLLAKARDGALMVLFEADESRVPIVSAAGETLRIGLRLTNPNFANFTEPAPARFPACLHYRNAAAPGALDAPVSLTLLGTRLFHALTRAARPVTVTLRDAAGLALRTETVTAEQNRTAVSFDLSGVNGACSLEEAYGAGATDITSYYADEDFFRAGVLAVVDVTVQQAFYANAPAFQLAFAARQETLKYYLVASKYTDQELDKLSVSDQGFGDDRRPAVAFTRVAAAAFTPAELPVAVLGGSDAKVVLFKSQAPVARRERARRKIQIRRNGTVLIENLPQPAADKTDANLIIHLSK